MAERKRKKKTEERKEKRKERKNGVGIKIKDRHIAWRKRREIRLRKRINKIAC